MTFCGWWRGHGTRRRRPRDTPATSRRDFLAALRSELPPALADLRNSNIAPVDFAQAAIGPGMAGRLHPLRLGAGSRRLPDAGAVHARRDQPHTDETLARQEAIWTRTPASASSGTSNTAPATRLRRSRSAVRRQEHVVRGLAARRGGCGREGQGPAPAPRRAGPGLEPGDGRADQPISDQSSAGTKRDRCLAFVVATITSTRPRVAACAARMTSPSSAGSAAVGRPC